MVALLEDSPIFTEEFWSSVKVTIRSLDISLTKAGCDTAWNRTRVWSDTCSTEMQCLRPLCHSGAPEVYSDRIQNILTVFSLYTKSEP